MIACRPRHLAALLAVGSWVAPSAQAPTFTARVDAVRVDVLVADRNGIVRGLQATDFDVRDNGVPQQVELLSFERIPVNMVLALDVSASVRGERLEHLQGAAQTLLERFRPEDRAALVTFGTLVRTRVPLTGDRARVRRGVLDARPAGETALVDAVSAAVTLGGDEGGRNLLVVFSDGLDTVSWMSPDVVVEAARRSDMVVYAVSVRAAEKPEFVRAVTDSTGGALVEIESTRDLSTTFLRVLDEFRQRYVLSYSPRGVESSGWHRLEVRVPGRRVTVRARAGYEADR